jgi:ubiquinone/menaquinone biosynthesis C-methylase UbiE
MSRERKSQSKPTWNPENTFTGTAWYYARYRPSYPDEVFNLLLEKFHLTKDLRVLDLGCGTGQIAIKLAPYVSEIVAMDPQVEMLAEGKLVATSRGISNIKWLRGESGELSEMAAEIGRVNLTVIARAFHWMDRVQTLGDLFKITLHGGGIAVVGDSGPADGAEQPWKEVILRTMKKWLGDERKAGTEGTYTHPKRRFEAYLKESEFSNYEEVSYKITRSWTPDEIVGYMYSTSMASLPVLGNKKASFEADLREQLLKIESTGHFQEPVTIKVMMVWKGLT